MTDSRNDEVRALWESKAEFWDERMGDGNLFQRELIGPASERLLGITPGERALDVCCGNGVFSRRLAALGAEVVAFDFSETFLKRAKERDTSRIEYRLIDATDEAELLSLGENRYDAAVCNMALMDMAAIDVLLRSLTKLLSPQGRFVFSVQHPCFNSNAVSLTAEIRGDLTARHEIKQSDYLNVPPGKGAGMPGEPNPHYYFHRPLHELFGACFAADFILDGLEEPALPDDSTDDTKLSWSNLPGIPPVLVARMRPKP